MKSVGFLTEPPSSADVEKARASLDRDIRTVRDMLWDAEVTTRPGETTELSHESFVELAETAARLAIQVMSVPEEQPKQRRLLNY